MRALLAISALLLLGAPAYGAIDTFIWFDSPREGISTPPSAGIQLTKFNNPSISDLEFRTGVAASGKRQWKPFTISKLVDAASPKLLRAFRNRAPMKITIVVNKQGTKQPLYTITLLGARLTSRSINSHDDENPKESMAHEVLSFTFEKITWTWMEGGKQKTMTDDWRQ
ncbi:MAG TPA: type VI secretion system tube protein TssD [Fimbriimonadaceae bacterium]|nr:type VI secretion system tube protein TssD [Fimbriimonadaceae bacterium]